MENEQIVEFDHNNQKRIISRYEYYAKLMAEITRKAKEEQSNGV